MKTTEYLFGKPNSAYMPCIEELATQRIADAKQLLKKLSRQRNAATPDELLALVHRYQKVEKAVLWWEEILNET